MPIDQTGRRILLEGANNARDLGGYPTLDGYRTRKGVFLRADSLHRLSDADIGQLLDMGLRLVIDLRSGQELERKPSRLCSLENVRYEHIAMFDGVQSAMFEGQLPRSMGDMYCHLLDRSFDNYRTIFRLFGETKGLSLFNCAAGKDRTGVLAMLLLKLAGVADDDVIEDYAISERNIYEASKRQIEQLRKQGIDAPEYLFQSHKEDMLMTLIHLRERYGGAFYYLRRCGLSDQEIRTVRKKFLT